MLIFRMKDEKSLVEIAEEVGGEVTKEQFFDLFERAIQTDHDHYLLTCSQRRITLVSLGAISQSFYCHDNYFLLLF